METRPESQLDACTVCRGACCESVMFKNYPGDQGRWLAFHGRRVEDGKIELECRCEKLSPEGRCTVHPTRPDVCREFMVGGKLCRATVKRRRTKDQRQEIERLLG